MDWKIVDTHVHTWNLEKLRYGWLDGNTSILNRSYPLEELEKERMAAGVKAGVLVQAANTLEETQYMLELAADNAWIKGVAGWVPLMQPSETERAISVFKKNLCFKGVRHLIHDEPDENWLCREEVVESLGLLAEAGIPYDVVGVKLSHLRNAIRIGEKIPSLKLVLDHLNQPPMNGKEDGEWRSLMKAAAGNKNIYAKISGLGTASGKPFGWTAADIEPAIVYVLEHFGPDHCLCGGDWPVSLLAGSYSHTWQTYVEVLAKLLPDRKELEAVLGETATALYQL